MTIGYNIIESALSRLSSGKDVNTFEKITIGTVVDTNDPQQMGRIRVRVPTLGDINKDVSDVPWALYMSPFAGNTLNISRGPDDNNSKSDVSYGMWNIPKVGAQVLVACIDGDPSLRVWLGCIYGQFMPHTMPHGRYIAKDGNLPGKRKPEGPLTGEETPIEPLYTNLKTAFRNDVPNNYEWRTRGADYSVSAVDEEIVGSGQVFSEMGDDKDTVHDNTSYRQGYALNRFVPEAEHPITKKFYDSQTYSWVTPGFHGMSMDDRPENCRMRFRTSAGNQIILDDTNERIYVSTAKGNCWIEMDQNGNIDIHSERRVSVHATKDINFTTDQSFRVHAKKGIHMYSGDEIRFHSKKDTHICTEQNLRVHSTQQTYIESDQNMNLKTSQQFRVFASQTLHVKSGKDIMLTGGPNIHLNGPTASNSLPANEKQAFSVNRIPLHEPYARRMVDLEISDVPVKNNIMSASDFNNENIYEVGYNDATVGKVELGETIKRGTHWRR